MIRPFRAETLRYGPFSMAGEFVYDHPFQWGSKRTGPDLHRVGGKYSDEWHRIHLINPRDLVPESNMPAYPWLADGHGRPGRHGAEDEGAAHGRRALHRRRHRQAPARRQGQDRARRADRLPAGARHRWSSRRESMHMDVNDLRVAVMLIGLLLFVGIWAWTWSSRRAAPPSTKRRGCPSSTTNRAWSPTEKNDERFLPQRLVGLRRRRHGRRPGLPAWCCWSWPAGAR